MALPMQWGIVFVVAIGGATGSVARYATAGLLPSPWGIFAINVLGSFLMGVVVELGALKLNLTPEWRAFLTVGVLGGFTTFSSFSLDSALLIQRGETITAALYIIGSVALSILALFAGLWLVRAL